MPSISTSERSCIRVKRSSFPTRFARHPKSGATKPQQKLNHKGHEGTQRKNNLTTAKAAPANLIDAAFPLCSFVTFVVNGFYVRLTSLSPPSSWEPPQTSPARAPA